MMFLVNFQFHYVENKIYLNYFLKNKKYTKNMQKIIKKIAINTKYK